MVNVMICDDALFMRKYLKRIVEKTGDRVVAEATNPDEAINFYNEHKPDLVLLDIIMPKGELASDGIEALAKIMKNDPDAKVVMCSSMGQQSLINEAKKIGAKDFIAKPFKPQDVIDKIAKYAKRVLSGSDQ